MFIKLIKISNFKSIKHLEIEPNSLSAIIGPNSSGKTNVLKAIDLILGEGWTTKAKVVKELFNDESLPVEITLEFDEAIVVMDKRGREIPISSLELNMQLRPDLDVSITANGGEPFWQMEQIKKHCHFIYIPSERSLSDELRVSHWTMLGKLMKQIHEAYLTNYDNDPAKLKDAFEKEMKPAKDFLEKDFSSGTSIITFNKFTEVFKKYCNQNSAGLANNFEPVLNIYNVNWFYKTLQIHVKEEFPGKYFDSEEVGSGMQTLLMISIFQTYAELMGKKVIFGIEEPEIYLYPQAQRSLYKTFIDLSENTQIFYTTHNPNFVDAARPDDMILIRKNFEDGTYMLKRDLYFNSITAEKEKYKIYTQFNPERNEIFFAKKVLLVEGDSDKILFTTLCKEKWKIDINKLGISIISCGGKSGVNYFIGVCNLIGLKDFYAVWDQDDKKFNPEKINFLPDTLKNKQGLEIKTNLEKFLGLPSSIDTNKTRNAYQWALKVSYDKIPDEFKQIKHFLNPENANSANIEVSTEDVKITIETTETSQDINPDDIPF